MRTLRLVASCFLITCLTAGSFAQSDPSTPNSSDLTPESGFVSPSKYTNAFFGFSLPLPKASAFRDYRLLFRDTRSRHFLFGLQRLSTNFLGSNPKLTILVVTAQQSGSASPEEARKAASGPKGLSVTRVEIDGREFWKSEVQEKVREGNTHSVGFATALNGYVLQFNIESFDRKLSDQLQQSIEATTFFDPSKAQQLAGPDSRAYNSASSAVAPRSH